MARFRDIRAVQARKITHPNSDRISSLGRLNLLVNCCDLPSDIEDDPNPRKANEKSRNKKIYKEVRNSLLGDQYSDPGFFDLMNRGIVIIVESSEFLGKNEDGSVNYRLHMPKGYGLVDGGHTFTIIADVNSDPILKQKLLNHSQHVEIRVIELPNKQEADILIPAIARGLNTSLQVDHMSIANLGKKFDAIKTVLNEEFSEEIENWPSDKEYKKLIGWKQTDVSYMDAKEILVIASSMDVKRWPKSNAVQCYSSPSTVFDNIITNDEVSRFVKILPNVLVLYNTIQAEFFERYKEDSDITKRSDHYSIIEIKKGGLYPFPFSSHEDNEYRLTKGALLPILSAFRIFVKYDESSQQLDWTIPFDDVLAKWDEFSPDLIERTINGAGNHSRNVANAIGKDSQHWTAIRDALALRNAGLDLL